MDNAPNVTVLVVGAQSSLGGRVLRGLEAVPGLTVLTTSADEHIEVVVHLSAGDHDARARRGESVTEGAAALLQIAETHAVAHLVLVSSALVYGAWPNNPVPLTEEAALRPDLEFVFARQLAAVEQMVEEWRVAAPQRSATVLRPVVSMAADGTSGLARALAAGMGQRFGEDDPGAQFLHLDDLSSAITLAARERLDGVFNVSPDGWIPGETVRALAGVAPRLKLPERVAEVISRVRWRFQRGPIPPGLRPYTQSSWLVANDRLKARGWHPTVTNEQAYVEGTESKWWTMITPKRKQELALGIMVASVVTLTSVVIMIIRRVQRSR